MGKGISLFSIRNLYGFINKVECFAYDRARDMAISKYKGILEENKFREVVNLNDNGLGFLLGIGNETPDLVVKISKSFLIFFTINNRPRMRKKIEVENRGLEPGFWP